MRANPVAGRRAQAKRDGSRRICPLLTHSGHSNALNRCLLLGVKRTLIGDAAMSANDPKRTSADSSLTTSGLPVDPLPCLVPSLGGGNATFPCEKGRLRQCARFLSR